MTRTRTTEIEVTRLAVRETVTTTDEAPESDPRPSLPLHKCAAQTVDTTADPLTEWANVIPFRRAG